MPLHKQQPLSLERLKAAFRELQESAGQAAVVFHAAAGAIAPPAPPPSARWDYTVGGPLASARMKVAIAAAIEPVALEEELPRGMHVEARMSGELRGCEVCGSLMERDERDLALSLAYTDNVEACRDCVADAANYAASFGDARTERMVRWLESHKAWRSGGGERGAGSRGGAG